MHPMYTERTGSNLWQGDIVDRAEVVAQNALTGHQDYIELRDDFVGFCVVAQTCDLVRELDRERRPRYPVDFICLAVIRKLGDVFSADAAKDKTKPLLEKIINHRENKEGYFYLHAHPPVIMGDGAVVDLRTTFSLHAEKHYDQILAARRLSLDDVFANKLGWMAGHLYSRVPNLEWDDLKADGEESAEQFITRMLSMIKKEGRRLPHEEAKWPTLDVFINNPAKLDSLDAESVRTLREKTRRVLELLQKRTERIDPG